MSVTKMCLIAYVVVTNRISYHYTCSFTRMQFVLDGQENQDANLGEDNYIFFLSGTEIGKAEQYVYVISVHL